MTHKAPKLALGPGTKPGTKKSPASLVADGAIVLVRSPTALLPDAIRQNFFTSLGRFRSGKPFAQQRLAETCAAPSTIIQNDYRLKTPPCQFLHTWTQTKSCTPHFGIPNGSIKSVVDPTFAVIRQN